jgi:hypothetical protein
MQLHLEVAAVAAVTACVTGAALFLLRKRRSPDEVERRRRATIHSRGRIIEGFISSARGNLLYYSYSWRGVEYEASQDVSAMLDRLPTDPEALVGPAAVRFLPGDPSNSIVLSEHWAGFPAQKARTDPQVCQE